MNWTERVRNLKFKETSEASNTRLYYTNFPTQYGNELRVMQVTCKNQEEIAKARNNAEKAQNSPHPHICKCLGWEEENNPAGGSFVYIFYPNILSSLQNDIDMRMQNANHYSEPLLWRLLEQCVETYAHLQKRGIVLRDIKPESILLLHPEDPEQIQIKVYSFSLAKHVDQSGSVTNTFCGIHPYCSPAIRKRDITPNETLVDDPFKSDVYSLGMVMLNLTLLELPQELLSLKNLATELEVKISGASDYSPEWQSILRLMLQVDERDRPDFLELSTYMASGNDEVLPARSDLVLPDQLTLTVKCGLPQVRVSPQQVDEVPCVVSIKAGTVDLNCRPYGVDIVCVIDQSGSTMDCDTLRYIQFALSDLVKGLDYYDRFALVGFSDSAALKCPLTCCTSKGKAKISAAIAQLEALDLTNLSAGLQLALEILQQRKYRNSVASIWLFTDGHYNVGKNPDCYLPVLQAFPPLTINCFGWGQSHSLFLRNLAKKGSGSFYHIRHIDLLKEAFVQALESLLTMAARDLVVKLDLISGAVPCTITNLYSTQDYARGEFRLPHITANQQRDLLFLLQPKQQSLSKPLSQHTVQVALNYTDCEGTVLPLTIPMVIKFVPMGPAAVHTVEIYKKWYCVMGADCLERARTMADQGDFQGARDVLVLGIETLKEAGYETYPEVNAVLQDLQVVLEVAASQGSWEQGGSQQCLRMVERHYGEVDLWEGRQGD